MIRWLTLALPCLVLSHWEGTSIPRQAPVDFARQQQSEPAKQAEPYKTTLRGKIVLLNEVLECRTGTKPDKDAPNPAVLMSDDGDLVPIIKDGRGRAFYQDKRLRNRPMELTVRSWAGIPYVQVRAVYSIKDGKRYHVDYWCDICAIVTYDMRLCPCCQDLFAPMRLREEPVGEP